MKYKYLFWVLVASIILLLSGCAGKVRIQEQIPTHNPTPSHNPMPSVTPSPLPVHDDESQPPIPSAKNESITILAVGDIMCHLDNLSAAYDRVTDTYDFKPFFEYVKPYIEKADLAIANLETVTAGKDAVYSSFPLFNTPEAILEALNYAGFDLLTTVNNHSLDRGKEGLITTIDKIAEHEMLHVGTKKEPGDRFIIVESNGFKIAVLAYSYAFNGNSVKLTKEEQEYMINRLNEAHIKSDIRQAKEKGAETVIVCLHWGTEYIIEPNEYQKELAMRIFGWGGDIILGSHPHVIQGSEIHHIDGKDRYVIYSMGNFISNFRKEDKAQRPNKEYTEDGVMVLIELSKDEEGNTLISAVDHIPTWVYKYTDDKINYRILPIPHMDYNDKDIQEQVKLSFLRTIKMVENYRSINLVR